MYEFLRFLKSIFNKKPEIFALNSKDVEGGMYTITSFTKGGTYFIVTKKGSYGNN